MAAIGTTPALFRGIPQHFGVKGQRYTRCLRLLSVTEREPTQVWQRRYSYRFIDAEGYRFEWYTDTQAGLERDREYRVTFRVKGFVWDRDKTTRIERCVIKIEVSK